VPAKKIDISYIVTQNMKICACQKDRWYHLPKNYSVIHIIDTRNVLHQSHEMALQIDGIQFLQHEHISS
jgi:hypothetical protein